MDDGATGWPIDVPALRSSLLDAGLPADATTRIVQSARPALMLAATPADENAIPLGATKIGGRPDLPAHLPWPERPAYPNAAELAREALDGAERFHADAGIVPPWMNAEDGAAMLAENRRLKAETQAFLRSLDVGEEDLDVAFRYGFTPEEAAGVAREAMMKAQAVANPFPLAFLAQIDLASLADRPGLDPALPREGRLYLFYDLFALPPSYSPASAIGLRVLYDRSPPGGLSRREMPEPLQRIADIAGTTLAPAAVALRPAATAVPQHASAAGKFGFADEDRQLYGEWLLAPPRLAGRRDGGKAPARRLAARDPALDGEHGPARQQRRRCRVIGGLQFARGNPAPGGSRCVAPRVPARPRRGDRQQAAGRAQHPRA